MDAEQRSKALKALDFETKLDEMLFRIKHIFPCDNPKRIKKFKNKLSEMKKKWKEYDDKRKSGWYKKKASTSL